MGRLIDADALKKALKDAHINMELTFDIATFNCVMNTIDNAPTIEVPDFKAGYRQAILDGKTTYAKQQGEWITYAVDIAPHPLHCKNCGWSNHHIKNEYIKEFKVCPNCGADMRGEKYGE